MSNFKRPDAESDKKMLAGGERINWEEKSWKPKPGENVIRILPAKADSPEGVSYHLKIAKHFFSFGPKNWEVFPCNQEMFGLPCPVCEKRIELYKTKDKALVEEANSLRVSSSGMFNIIDRLVPGASSLLYEAPYSVWFKIVQLASSGGRFSNLIYEEGPNGEVLGRDILLVYNPKAPAPQRYQVMPDELSPLGSDEDIEKWMDSIVVLSPTTFWKPVDYDEAYLRAFGTDEDRRLLKESREANKQQGGAEQSDAAEEQPKAAPVAAPKEAVKPKPVSEKKPVPAATVAPSPSAAPTSGLNDLASRIRARAAAAKESEKK